MEMRVEGWAGGSHGDGEKQPIQERCWEGDSAGSGGGLGGAKGQRSTEGSGSLASCTCSDSHTSENLGPLCSLGSLRMLLNTAYGQMVAGLLLLSCVKLASEAGVGQVSGTYLQGILAVDTNK